ncbi:MAG: hypothetical protein AAF432_00915 [Planctomycetota bacterium]
MRLTPIILTMACVASLATASDPTEPTYIRPIEQGIGDVGPGATSLRLLETGLQLPSGFSDVYESPIDGQFMRVDGALHAVFPRSRYVETGRGQLIATVPDGTVYYIGRPEATESDETDIERPAPPTLLDFRVSAARPGIVINRGAHPSAIPDGQSAAMTAPLAIVAPDMPNDWRDVIEAPTSTPTIVNDEGYRRQRIHALLRRASQAESVE